MIGISKPLILGSFIISTLGTGLSFNVNQNLQVYKQHQTLKVIDKTNYDFESFLKNKNLQEKEIIENNFYDSLEQYDNDIKINMNKINKNLFNETILNIFESTLIKNTSLQTILNFANKNAKKIEIFKDSNNDKFRAVGDTVWYTWITGYWYLNFNNYASEWISFYGSNVADLTGVLADGLSGTPFSLGVQALALVLSGVTKIFQDNNKGNGVYIGMAGLAPLIGWGSSGHNWN